MVRSFRFLPGSEGNDHRAPALLVLLPCLLMAQTDSSATEAVLAAIATGSSVNDAAELAGVSRRTASRIVNDPRSQERLAGMREATMDHAARRMLGLVDLAADTLDAVMRDADA